MSAVLTHLVGALGREWLTMRELAVYAKFPTAEAARKFVTRHRDQLVLARRGRVLLVDRHAFDRYLEQTQRIA